MKRLQNSQVDGAERQQLFTISSYCAHCTLLSLREIFDIILIGWNLLTCLISPDNHMSISMVNVYANRICQVIFAHRSRIC